MYESMKIEDTIRWIDGCPHWCDGDFPGDNGNPIHGTRSSLMILTNNGLVTARRRIQQLIPGIDYRYSVSGPLGFMQIVMTDDETLGEFEDRAEIALTEYERDVNVWIENNRAVTK